MNPMKIYTLLLVVCLAGCSSHHKSHKTVVTTPMEVNVVSGDIVMSDLYSSLEYIKLETNPSCLIAQIADIIPYKDGIIIVDKEMSNILQFDLKGSFKGKIGNVGVGPGEYVGINDVALDVEGNRAFVLDVSGTQVLVYELDSGKYLENLKWDFIATEIEFLNSDALACYCDFAANEEYTDKEGRPNLILYNLNNHTRTSFLYVPKEISSQEVTSPFSALASHSGSEAVLFSVLENSVHIINSSGIGNSYEFFLPGDKSKMESYVEQLRTENLNASQIMPGAPFAPTYSMIISCVPGEKYMLFTMINYQNGKVTMVAYNPISKCSVSGTRIGGYPLQNDIDGCIPFAPYAASDDAIYGAIESYQFAGQSEVNDAALQELISETQEDDNPIIVVAKTKELKYPIH